MKSIPGVVSVTSGYANGTPGAEPSYEAVCTGKTGFRETVRVRYDPETVSLAKILFAFFSVIDPTVENAQGNDVGPQYQTGIYYVDESSKETVERIAAVERERSKKFAVEIGPLENFYDAEAYHQNYLDLHPGGYCHIPKAEIAAAANMVVDPGNYRRPAKEIITEKLTPGSLRSRRKPARSAPSRTNTGIISARHLCGRRYGRTAFFLKRQVREFLRLAQLFVRAGRKRTQIS